jgi:hypothetical protein
MELAACSQPRSVLVCTNTASPTQNGDLVRIVQHLSHPLDFLVARDELLDVGVIGGAARSPRRVAKRCRRAGKNRDPVARPLRSASQFQGHRHLFMGATRVRGSGYTTEEMLWMRLFGNKSPRSHGWVCARRSREPEHGSDAHRRSPLIEDGDCPAHNFRAHTRQVSCQVRLGSGSKGSGLFGRTGIH